MARIRNPQKRKMLEHARKRHRSPIITGGKGFMTGETMTRIAQRWHARSGGQKVHSHTPVRRGVTAQLVARRFVNRHLLAYLSLKGITVEEKRIITALMVTEKREIPGTKEILSDPRTVILVRLANTSGKERGQQLLDSVAQKSGELRALASSEKVFGATRTDTFQNATSMPLLLPDVFKRISDNRRYTLSSLDTFIAERKAQLQRLNGTQLPSAARRLLQLSRAELIDAIEQKAIFEAHGQHP